MDILFDLSPTGQRGTAPRVIGTMSRPLDVAYSGEVHLLGIRFKPGGARPYLAVEASALTDRNASLDDVWGAEARKLQERVMGQPNGEAHARLLDQVLRERLTRSELPPDEAVLRASELAASTPRCGVDAMARASGLGRRQLERRFLAVVGVSPKTACRIMRFSKAVTHLDRDPLVDLSRLALRAGYSDQPHFTREFRALSGRTPGQYRSLRMTA